MFFCRLSTENILVNIPRLYHLHVRFRMCRGIIRSVWSQDGVKVYNFRARLQALRMIRHITSCRNVISIERKASAFHINFTSFHCTERYELNKLTSLPICGFIVQLVEHHTDIVEVTGSNPVEALIDSNASFPIFALRVIDFFATLSFLVRFSVQDEEF